MFDLKGKVAIVTGASRGLGQAMAVGLAEAGASIVGIGTSSLAETKNLVEKSGSIFYEIIANLQSIEPLKKIIKETVDYFGKVDILVNNAGIIRRDDSINFSEKDWDEVMNVNLKSLFFLSQEFAKQIVSQKSGGKIINIASMLSFQGGIRVPSYTASKSGVRGLTMLLANEWARYNIQVNAIAPGYMATDNTKDLQNDEERNQSIINRIPAQRWGTPEDLKGPVVFLASEASNYVNGFTLAVDGGWLSR